MNLYILPKILLMVSLRLNESLMSYPNALHILKQKRTRLLLILTLPNEQLNIDRACPVTIIIPVSGPRILVEEMI